jgi:hypothetical protein
MKFIISLIALNLLSAEYSLTADDDKKNNRSAAVSNIDSAQYWAQTNVSLNLKDPIGLGVLIKKGQQIKINNDSRKLFFQGYNPVSNTITVKDISYKVFYTKHKKLEYNLSEIDKIQLRVDDTFKKAILLWYPNVFVHAMPLALIGGIIFRLASVEFDEEGRVKKPFPSIIFNALMFYSIGTGFINSWPTAKKYGKGEWLPIPLKGSSAWRITNE